MGRPRSERTKDSSRIKEEKSKKNDTKNIDHEDSKLKIKENHDSHQTRYKKAIVNTIKNDDIEKRNKKIIIQKNPRELTLWKPRSKKIENSSIRKEIKTKAVPEIKIDKEEDIKKEIKEVDNQKE